MFARLISLIGEEAFKTIQNKKVLLIGVGGVGSYALEALIRNGFSHITVIDADDIELSNLNRQLITHSENIGLAKVVEAIKRAKLINPEVQIRGIKLFLTRDNLFNILNEDYDYIIDACDTLEIKYLLMENSFNYSYRLISSMGTAKKLDPTKLTITTLDKTFNDPIARILRQRIKNRSKMAKIHVIASTEQPQDIKTLGSNNLVPSVAGLLCVTYIVNDIINKS